MLPVDPPVVVTDPPVVDDPIVTPPVIEDPVVNPPVVDPPIVTPPVITPPVEEEPTPPIDSSWGIESNGTYVRNFQAYWFSTTSMKYMTLSVRFKYKSPTEIRGNWKLLVYNNVGVLIQVTTFIADLDKNFKQLSFSNPVNECSDARSLTYIELNTYYAPSATSSLCTSEICFIQGNFYSITHFDIPGIAFRFEPDK